MKTKIDLIKWKFKALDLSSPKVMGILNITPDSFYDGGKYELEKRALKQVEKMLLEGAGIIDIGALSTRPFARQVDGEEEWNRLKKILPVIRKAFPAELISIDSYRSDVASKAIEEGADLINDISGGQFDKGMLTFVANNDVPYIMMHTNGKPETMQIEPNYENVVSEVDSFFRNQLTKLERLGKMQNIILDPGFGFGKTVTHNYQLLHGLSVFKNHGYPVLAGLSRKSMINKVIGTQPETALNGTTALNMLALVNGANILRVHDVEAAVQTIKLWEAYQGS